MNATIESVRLLLGAPGRYATRLARSDADVAAAQTLRYEVFNLELNEGFADSHATGRDEDAFDPVCDHLLVEDRATGSVVGTYRLQTGRTAAAQRGYYCEQEFAFAPFESIRNQIIELGRACVHRQHRNVFVLGLLWKGIADYASARNGRYLIGCSSLTAQDPAVGASAYSDLCRKHLAPLPWRTKPLPAYECSLAQVAPEPVAIPKLLRAYLALGAKICGPPAVDRDFKTIDFLTIMDIERMTMQARARFFGLV